MKQFILKNEPDRNGRLRLEGSDYRYLVKVRRLAPGEFFPVVLPDGTGASVRVVSVDNKVLVGDISPDTSRDDITYQKALSPIILFQALPKSDKMDLIVRQAAEGALAEIVPFESEFSIAKISANEQKIIRWERIIKEARQQSGSSTTTTIRKPLPIDELFAYWEQITMQQPGTLGLLFHHLPLANESLHRYLGNSSGSQVSNQSEAAASPVVIAIGPEGGFSPAEVERFLSAGFKPFTIGNTILRTETAALYAQAAVRLLLLEKDSWEMK